MPKLWNAIGTGIGTFSRIGRAAAWHRRPRAAGEILKPPSEREDQIRLGGKRTGRRRAGDPDRADVLRLVGSPLMVPTRCGPDLIRVVAVDTEQDQARFEMLGTRAVVNRNVPRGLDLAAAVLRARGVEEAGMRAWMQRQQERALNTAAAPAAADSAFRSQPDLLV